MLAPLGRTSAREGQPLSEVEHAQDHDRWTATVGGGNPVAIGPKSVEPMLPTAAGQGRKSAASVTSGESVPLMVSLAGLRAIEALATHGSITAAAAALGYTPSAVSQQITRLERDVKQLLVERQGRRASLTLAGKTLAESASRVIIELESVTAELQAQAETVTGLLVVAAFPTAARGIVPSAMRALTQDWPGIELRILEVDSHRAVDLVAGGNADLAVAHDWLVMPMSLPDGLQARHLGDDVSDVLVHESHPAAKVSLLDLEDLKDESWLYEPGSVAHDFLLHAYRRQANPLHAGHMISEYATQVELVDAGLGLALVPRMGRGALPPSVRALTVRSPPLRRIYGVWRSSTGARPAITAALGALAEACARNETATGDQAGMSGEPTIGQESAGGR